MNPDNKITEASVIEAGHVFLSAAELTQKISNKTVYGDYGLQFKFVSTIKEDGTMEGRNNAGAHNLGEWSVDAQNNTFSVMWDAGWDKTTTRAYWIDDELKFFDSHNCLWRTTFTRILDGCKDINWQLTSD